MRRVVRPRRGSAAVGHIAAIEVVPVHERIVHHDGAVPPSRMPAPSAPAVPPGAEVDAHIDGTAESEVEPASKERALRPPPARIGIPHGRTPDPHRIVHRHVDDLGVGRLDVNVGLAAGGGRRHVLLCGGLQLPRLLRFLAHALNRVHHALLLGQKRIAQVGGPDDVVIQPLQHIGENRQRLHAGVPVLLLCGLRQRGPGYPGILLHPLVSLDQLQRISGRHQNLAQQRIGIERNRRYQIVQLIRAESLIRRWRSRRSLLRQENPCA